MKEEMVEENANGEGVPLEMQNQIAQGQAENGAIGKTNLGKNPKEPDTDGSATEAPTLDIKKAKI